MKNNINKSYFVKTVLYLPTIQKIIKNKVAVINLQEATLAGAKYSRLILIAIKADPQIADKIKSKKILLKDFNLYRNQILFFGVGISIVSRGFI